MELQQTPEYANYVKKLGWNIDQIDTVSIFYRNFPFIGALGKLQRIKTFPKIDHLHQFCTNHHITRLVIEPGRNVDQSEFTRWSSEVKKFVKVIDSPYLPTKTIIIDINKSEEDIFKNFSEAKRRAVRRAIKYNITTEESKNIKEMIRIKNKSAGFLGFITTQGLKELSESFNPNQTTSVLAYVNSKDQPLTDNKQPTNDNPQPTTHYSQLITHEGDSSLAHRSFGMTDKNPTQNQPLTANRQLVGGVFLIFWEDTAYYWIAGTTKKGKKMFAPTLLVWESIKISRKYHMKYFDFVGVWDERFPNDGKDWKGFTKFKEGFGGKEVYYPNHRI